MKMKEINIGVKFEDERTGKVCTVVEKNSKYKTLLLEPEGESAFSTSLATFNKYFTEVADLDDLSTPPVEEEIMPEVDETAEDMITTWNSKTKFTWKEILDVFIGKGIDLVDSTPDLDEVIQWFEEQVVDWSIFWNIFAEELAKFVKA